MTKNKSDQILVSSVLTAVASEELQKEVDEELKVEDPKDENSLASLLEKSTNESAK